MLKDSELKRIVVRVSGGVSSEPVRYYRAHALVQEGRASWVHHPEEGRHRQAEIRITSTAATKAAMASGYDRLRRKLTCSELRRLPVVGNLDRMLNHPKKQVWVDQLLRNSGTR